MADETCDSPRLIPEARVKAFRDRPARTLPRVPGGHYAEFIRACKGDGTTGADFAYGAHLTEICHLGNIAKRVEGRIAWDAAAMRVTNNDAAHRWVLPPRREGWSL